MGTVTQGKRVYTIDEHLRRLNECEYGKNSADGNWYACTPNGHLAGLGNGVSHHKIVEHEDGTITVSPSILVSTSDANRKRVHVWHGYLEKGIWREC